MSLKEIVVKYQIIILKKEKGEKYHTVCIPAFDGITEGRDKKDSINMAKDYIKNMLVEGVKPLEANSQNEFFDNDQVLLKTKIAVD